MTKRIKTTANSVSGSVLMAVLFAIGVMALLLGAVYTTTTMEMRSMQRSLDRETAIAYADGVMESLFDQWRMAMISSNSDKTQHASGLSTSELMNGTPSSPSTTVPSGLPLAAPSASQLPVPRGVSLSQWSVKAADPYLNPLVSGTSRPLPENGTSSRLRVRLYYIATVTVNFPKGGTATVQRTFVRAGRNLFDNFLFSAQPVTEINPGPAMYVNGTIYCGGDLYTAQSSLHMLMDVSYTGSWYKDYKGGNGLPSSSWDSRYGSTTPSIDSGSWNTSDPPHLGVQQKLLDTPMSTLDPNFLDDPTSNNVDSDGNPNNNGYGEILKEVTNPAKSDPLQVDTNGTSERLANNADYRIYVDANNNVTVYKSTSTTALSTSNSEYLAITGAMATDAAIQDVRQADNVRLVNVDIGAITTAYTAGKISDANNKGDGLLLYINDTSFGTSVTTNGYVYKPGNGNGSGTVQLKKVTSSRMRGVRLVNGAALPSSGLSVASPNPIYIQGDYNTTDTAHSSTTQPPSDGSSAYLVAGVDPSPIVSGAIRASSVVAGDAVNILSNAWTDANAVLCQSQGFAPPASHTTVNTAIVAGNVPTTSSSYSGGIENFPRFHENWSNQNFTIYGSFGLLYDSAQATGAWASALYSPPNRHWYFDQTLSDNNPPGFPVAYTYDRGRWLLR